MTSIALPLGAPRPLRRLRTPFIVAFAAAALAAGLGRAVTTSYLPLLLERIENAPGLIGMVMLVNAAAGMAVPLVTGIWSDRLSERGRGRRIPFIVGGSVVTAGGLLAIALGFSSSYLVLALFAAVVYTGLNALTTAHRAMIPETFDESGRARATSAQELAMLAGGLIGLALGGLLFGIAPWAPFALSAVLVPLLAAPTISRIREPRAIEGEERATDSYTATYYLRAMRRPGVAAFLVAQILWVLGYAALPAFFLLYAEDVLALEPGVASLWLAGFGLATGVAIVGAGRVRNPALHRPLLLLGVALLGGGFLGVAASTSLPLVGAALVVGAAGFGLVSTLGFPLFSKLIPKGEAGGYTALYFSVRAISSTIALPAAGWTVAATGSYRALFVLGGVATLTALVPLVGSRPRVKGRGWTALALIAVRAGPRTPRRADDAEPPRRVALPADQRPRPRPGSALDDPRPAHAQLRRADPPCSGRGSADRAAAHSGRPRARARIRAPRLGAPRSDLRGLRPAAPGGDAHERQPERAQLGAPELLPERAHGDHGSARDLHRAPLPAPAHDPHRVHRGGRLHARDVRRALPARRHRRHRARHGQRAARRGRSRAAARTGRAGVRGRAAARGREHRRSDAVVQRRASRAARRVDARARGSARARRRRL